MIGLHDVVLFGPPTRASLAATASMAAARGRNIGYLFNRKEAKTMARAAFLLGRYWPTAIGC